MTLGLANPNQAIIDDLNSLRKRVESLERAPWDYIVTSGAALAAGDIIMGGAARNGCLLCDGTSYLKASYPALNTWMATQTPTYPYGSDALHFDVPDYRGVAPIGAGTGSGLTARTFGVLVGTESVTLTGAQSGIASHVHTIGGSTGSDGGQSLTTGSTTPGSTGSTTPGNTGTESADHNHSFGGNAVAFVRESCHHFA